MTLATKCTQPRKLFHPVALYFTFPPSAVSSLHKSAMMLQAHGFIGVFERASNFRDVLIALEYSRNLAVKHGVRGVTLKDIKTSRLNESMITLGNIKSVLFVGSIIACSAFVSFVAETCSNYNFHNVLVLVKNISGRGWLSDLRKSCKWLAISAFWTQLLVHVKQCNVFPWAHHRK